MNEMNEQLALELKYIRSIQWSPLRPGDWQKLVKKCLKQQSIEEQAVKINWPLDKFIAELNKTELQQYDEFDECLVISYFGISYKALLFLGAVSDRNTTHVTLSQDEEYRTKLAKCNYYYHTINRND